MEMSRRDLIGESLISSAGLDGSIRGWKVLSPPQPRVEARSQEDMGVGRGLT